MGTALNDYQRDFYKLAMQATSGSLEDVAYLFYKDLLALLQGGYPTFGGVLSNYKETLYTATTSGNVTINLANGNLQRFILDAARQFTMPADPGAYGQSFVLILECATYTPTWNTSPAIEWLTSDGAAPTLVTTANLVNVLTFIWDDVDSRWLGFLAGKETA